MPLHFYALKTENTHKICKYSRELLPLHAKVFTNKSINIMRLTDLKPNVGQIEGVPRNPRQITGEEFAKLKKSLKNFYKMLALRPIVVDEGLNILGGNMRYQALKKLAEEGAVAQVFDIRGALVSYYKFEDEIPDDWVKVATDLTPDEKMEFIVKDNEERGQWDYDLLANEWDAEKLREWDIEAANWDDGKSWDDLGYIDKEQKDPELEKPIKIIVSIPKDREADERVIRSLIEDVLKGFSGCEIK